MLTDRRPRLRVLIVDDHELTRLTLKILFSQQENLEVVGLAANGLEAIAQVTEYDPDVIVLDLQMPVLNGLSAASRIKQISPDTKILGYSSVEDPQIEVMCQTAPIDNFCPKNVPANRLLEMVYQLGQTKLNHLSVH